MPQSIKHEVLNVVQNPYKVLGVLLEFCDCRPRNFDETNSGMQSVIHQGTEMDNKKLVDAVRCFDCLASKRSPYTSLLPATLPVSIYRVNNHYYWCVVF